MATTVDIEIDSGSDIGKTFVVQRMPLIRGDRWANRLALALCKSGVNVDGLVSHDEQGRPVFNGLMQIGNIANIVIKAVGGIDDHVAQSLLDELQEFIKVRLKDGSTRSAILESDITSIDTLWKLRIACIKVNLDFLRAGVTQ